MLVNIENVMLILPINDEGMVVLELYSSIISPEDFVMRFDGAELTCTSLSAHQNATPGWITQFVKWRDDGVIPA